MHKLTKSQTRKAEAMADEMSSHELGQIAIESGIEGDVASWAIYLQGQRRMASQGKPLHGYTGRQSR